MEDAAHTFPSRIGESGRMAGTVGRVGAYSFYATKTITTGEGGMLVTDDDGLAARARLMWLHGIGRDAWKRYAAGGSWYYEIEAAGYKYNLIDQPADEPDGSHAWHLFIVRLRLDSLLIDRATVVARLGEEGVGASVHFIPLHLHPYYRRQGWRPEDCPTACAEYERVISLPLWPGMTRENVQRVVDTLTGIVASARREGAA